MRWIDGTDLGSIESTGGDGGKYDFQLFSADFAKLPTDVAAGSSAMVLDTKKLYLFHAQSKRWVEM